tara:strand:+ start:225 stop:833 length:609 start_codon:yes stop_codon:yes gene_type:complete
MRKYLKVFVEILINYHIYSIPILIFEIFFYIKYPNKYNKFKYSSNNILSDSIPCPFYFLKKIEKFLKNKKIQHILDLGSGYGKALFFFGKVKKFKIDGIELDKKIYIESLSLKNNNINVYNKNILQFDFFNKKYELFIINDPLKKFSDSKKLINKILRIKKKKYLVLINLSKEKSNYIKKNLKVLNKLEISLKRNIYFCTKK